MSNHPERRHQWLWIGVSLLALITVIVFISLAEDSIDVEQSVEPPALQPVTVEHLLVAPEVAQISTNAEIHPRWSAQLRAAVSGRIVEVHDSALAGQRVEQGTTLISIEPSHYVAEVSSAELALKQAELDLLIAEKNTSVARAQYSQDGIKAANDLALQLPQLRLAKSAVESARARVAASNTELANTTISAPFAGYVVERFVSPGQSVNVGEALVDLVDDQRFELIVEISRADWLLLRQPLTDLNAKILDQQGQPIAQARIRQGGGFLDATTRQYRVFLEISHPTEAQVLSGDFVEVLLPGITVPAALNIAESSLTQEGYVWYVDEQDRLQHLSPEVLFRRQERIVIRAPEGPDNWRISTHPLVSFLPGQQVVPRVAGEE